METTPTEPNVKALIVEDETDICYLLSGILRKKNLSTSYVTSLNEAGKTLSRENPAILFLDNHLPDGYGVDFISEVKREHPHTKVVIITAHDTIADKERALRSGADYFIGKPFTKDTINTTVDVLMNQ